MIDAGELEVAIDELRWLIEGCRDFIQAHQLLGELALSADEDLPLARGHFGRAYRLGCQALERAKMPSPLPALHPANRPFFEAGRGLAWCLHQLGKRSQGAEIVDQLLACDPSDALALQAWWDDLPCGGAPIVPLELPRQ